MTAKKTIGAISMRNGYKPYTEDEVKFLLDNRNILTSAQMAQKLHRKESSVTNKLFNLRAKEKAAAKAEKQKYSSPDIQPRMKTVNSIVSANVLTINLNTQTLGTIRALIANLEKRGINYSLVGAA